MRNFFYATATLVGIIVGAGIFGIPYVTAQAGFWVGQFYIIFLAGVTLLVHLSYGEVVERTEGTHRLPGYAEKYLGKGARHLITFAFFFSGYAALLLYILIAGVFLHTLSASQLSAEWGSVFLWIFGSFAIARGLRAVGWIEFVTGIFLFVVFVVIVGLGVPHVRADNFRGWSPDNILLPYGVVLFAMAGVTAIPEVRALLGAGGKRFGAAIVAGTLIPAVLYMIFVTIVVGVSGAETSPEALRGLLPALGGGAVWLGSLFGFLAITKAFMVLGITIKDTLLYDFRIPNYFSTALTTGVPAALFFLGVRQFIEIMDVSGAVLGAIIGVSVLLMVLRARRHGDRSPGLSIPVPSAIIYSAAVVLAGGGILQVVYIIFQNV